MASRFFTACFSFIPPLLDPSTREKLHDTSNRSPSEWSFLFWIYIYMYIYDNRDENWDEDRSFCIIKRETLALFLVFLITLLPFLLFFFLSYFISIYILLRARFHDRFSVSGGDVRIMMYIWFWYLFNLECAVFDQWMQIIKKKYKGLNSFFFW